MCLYPRLIKNKKYEPNKKNGGIVPAVSDMRVLAVPIGCGECMECRKQKKTAWQVRLLEEVREKTNGIFVTLTFSNDRFRKYARRHKFKKGYELDNAIATEAVKHFLERWRKEFKKSVKHWLITELGHNGTENVHLHGIIWTNETAEKIREHWKNGFVWLGNQDSAGRITNYVNEKTVNYIIKYITKIDEKHKAYQPKILCSKGIGAGYMKRSDWENAKYNENGETKDYYKSKQGYKIKQPIYYRNKIYTDHEKEQLWLKMLDKEERWVGGEKVSIKGNDYEEYNKLVDWYRAKNKQLGYGNGHFKWDKKNYEEERRELLHRKRLNEDEAAAAHCRGARDAFALDDTRFANKTLIREDWQKEWEYIDETKFEKNMPSWVTEQGIIKSW